MNARMQLIASSNFVVQQNNDRLKEVESLGLNDIDNPLVETLKSALKDRTLVELANDPKNDALQEYIPEKYRVKDLPLVWLRNDTYRGITDEDRKGIFNLY